MTFDLSLTFFARGWLHEAKFGYSLTELHGRAERGEVVLETHVRIARSVDRDVHFQHS